MGLLVKGEWHDKWYDTDKSDGAFEREDAQLRSWVRRTAVLVLPETPVSRPSRAAITCMSRWLVPGPIVP